MELYLSSDLYLMNLLENQDLASRITKKKFNFSGSLFGNIITVEN